MAQQEVGKFPADIPRDLTLDEIEKAAILQSLDRTNGNRTHAAQSLDIISQPGGGTSVLCYLTLEHGQHDG